MKFPIPNFQFPISGKGFTFIDILVGISLMLIVFLGVFAAFQLGLKVVGVSQAKIIATSFANQKLETARNLPYQKVGIEGIDEGGTLKEIEYYPSDNPKYTIYTDVDCRNNPDDGVDDACLCDYKTVTVTVSWTGRFGGEITLATDIAPKNDIQECEKQGGVFEAKVFNVQGEGIADAQVKVEDINTGIVEQCSTDLGGKCAGEKGIFLSTSPEAENYKVTVTKTGYSTEQTFKSGDLYDSKIIANPEKPNLTILEGQITEKSFSIDQVSTFSMETRSSRGRDSFDDEFNDLGKISDYLNISVSEGEVTLSKTNGDYVGSGYLISTEISSSVLISWYELSWVEDAPSGANIKYQLFFLSGTDWLLIPDTDLPGNSTGLGSSPVDLADLDISDYQQLKIKGTLSTGDPSKTPSLSGWSLGYLTRAAQPITASFDLRGEKIVGTDITEEPIYKYLPTEHIINHSAEISGLERDTYNFSNFSVEGESLDLEEAVPGEIQLDGSLAINLPPNTIQPLVLYFAAENTLLLLVQDSEDSQPVFSAGARLYSASLGYDKTQQTDEQGKAFFMPLEEAIYNLEVTAEGYETYIDQISVLGDSTFIINLILSPS
jgi:hypothetical protein